MPIRGKRQAEIMREDLIEALRGLTIQFELKIKDVIAEAPSTDSNQMPVKEPTDEEGATNANVGEPSVEPLKAAASMATREPVKEPIRELVKEHASKPVGKPVRELVEEAVRQPAKVPNGNHARELVEEPVQQPAKVPNGNQVQEPPGETFRQPAAREPNGNQLREPVEEPIRQPFREPARDSVIRPVLEPIREVPSGPVRRPVRPAIIWGSLKVGSTISTCWLSEDTSLNPPVTYITYNNEKLLTVTKMLNEFAKGIEKLPKLDSINVHDIVLGQSMEDDSWYRATAMEVLGSKVDVFYVDWGSRETLDLERVRYLSDARLSLTTHPACAVKVRFTNENSDELKELFSSGFNVTVESYDEFDGVYLVRAEMS
jgi:hypothetical protein